MSIMMVQVDVMCCKSVGTDLSMLDINDLMTEICQLKKEVKLLETKLGERDELNREDVCGVSLCDVTDQTSPDLLLSVCNEEQKTSVKLLDCEMKLKTQIKKEQTEEDVIYSGVYYRNNRIKEESSEPNKMERHHNFKTGEESVSCLNTEKNFPQNKSQIATGKNSHMCPQCKKIFTRKDNLNKHMRVHTREKLHTCDQCGKSFTWAQSLRAHHLYHSGVRSFHCELCGKSFSHKDHLNEHDGSHWRKAVQM